LKKIRQKSNESEISLADSSLDTPHAKAPLTTVMGRLVERASYTDLIIAAALILLASTTYFSLAARGHSLATSTGPLDVGVLDAFYFSIVTFTSLGYGDLSPQGLGRASACIVVLFGLVLVALLVGKFASERQQAFLLLIHTSDCQRRIEDFTTQLENSKLELIVATEADLCVPMLAVSKRLAGQLEAVTRYLIFNANQAGLISFGNASTLRALYRTLEHVQRACVTAHKSTTANQVVAARTLAISMRLSGLMSLMRRFHREANNKLSYSRSFIVWIRQCLLRKISPPHDSPSSQEITAISLRMSREAEALNKWARSTLTPSRCEAVWQATPLGEPSSWPKYLNKTLAKELAISNSLAQRCLDELLSSGRLPKGSRTLRGS
jgi:hypothetical protein